MTTEIINLNFILNLKHNINNKTYPYNSNENCNIILIFRPQT